MKTWERKLEKEVKRNLKNDSSGHDCHHALRFKKIAFKIAKNEKNIDRDVLKASCLLHDVGYSKGPRKHVADGMKISKKILKKINFPEEKSDKVIKAVKFHDLFPWQRGYKKPKEKEILILQDADNIDAIGAIGLARVFMFCGAHKIKMYDPKGKIYPKWETGVKSRSAIHHFYDKLLKTKDILNTRKAKTMAKRRHDVLIGYLKEFKREWI